MTLTSVLKKDLLINPYIILLLLVVLAFANSLQNSFVWDDGPLIVYNPGINMPFKEMPSIFLTPLWKIGTGSSESPQIYYRPVVTMLFVLNYKIWGLNPAGFHLTSIIFHLIIAIVLYKTGLLLFNNDKLASLISASIFAVHPVNNEPVGRAASGEVIFGFFVILSLYFFLKEKKYLSWIAFSLSLLSKETAVMLPFALVILSIDKKGLKKGAIEVLPYAFIVGLYLMLRMTVVNTVLGDEVGQPVLTRLLTMIVATFDYIRLLIIPYPLNPIYPGRWYTSISQPKVLLATLIVISILVLAIKIRRNKTMLFLLSSTFIMLLPVILRVNAFPSAKSSFYTAYIAERFLYAPLMFFSLFSAGSAITLLKDKRRSYLATGWIMVLIVFIPITIVSNKIWKDNLTLFGKIVKESPDSPYVLTYLGNAYYENEQLAEAVKEYKKVLGLNPDPEIALTVRINLGTIYIKQGRFDEAIREFNANLKPMPDAHKFDNVHSRQGALNQADINKTFWEYQPCFADTHFNLGLVYLAQGHIDKAARKFKVATILSPDFAEAHYSLGNIYQKQGKFSDAIKEYETVLRLDSKHADARQNLEILNIKKKQLH
ncbi:MAG: tetratricopeptide repeat protein [Thermodesulfovibrionales bacterium]